MTFIGTAKRLLAAKATGLALTVLPLVAAIAVGAQSARAVGFDVNASGHCVVSNGSGSCSVGEVSPIGGNPGGNWVDLFTLGDVSAVSNRVVLSYVENGDGITGTVTAGEEIPFSWDFFIIDGGSGGSVTWRIEAKMTGSDNFLIYDTGILTSSTGSHIQGSALMTVLVDGAPDDFSLKLLASSTSPFSINIPADATIAFNPASAAAVPEPASLLFSGLGLTAIALMKKKVRQKKSWVDSGSGSLPSE